jgi:hypothetical protein
MGWGAGPWAVESITSQKRMKVSRERGPQTTGPTSTSAARWVGA